MSEVRGEEEIRGRAARRRVGSVKSILRVSLKWD